MPEDVEDHLDMTEARRRLAGGDGERIDFDDAVESLGRRPRRDD